MKILVTGSKGMLGTDLLRVLEGSHIVVGVDLDELDVTRPSDVLEFVGSCTPDVLINLAAFTDVDGSETTREAAFSVNVDGARNVAAACRQLGVRLIHVSTDYVFDGRKEGPYREEDPPNPLGTYGRSKWEGEQGVRGILPSACVVRTAWLYGKGGRNFVEAILAQSERSKVLRVVDDQRGSPTYTMDLAFALRTAAESGLEGTYHVTNQGACTWFGFARKILELSGKHDVEVLPISTEELGRPAPRPMNSVLDCTRFEQATGMRLRGWEEALRAYLLDR